MTITEHMVNTKYGKKITNGPRIQMQTAGSKKKEDWTEVSKEQLAEVKLPVSFEKLKEQNSYFYHGENISDYELVQTAVALGKMVLWRIYTARMEQNRWINFGNSKARMVELFSIVCSRELISLQWREKS